MAILAILGAWLPPAMKSDLRGMLTPSLARLCKTETERCAELRQNLGTANLWSCIFQLGGLPLRRGPEEAAPSSTRLCQEICHV